MSKDKHKRQERRLNLLRTAVRRPLYFHCIGGLAMKDRDVKRLIRDGHLKFARGKWTGTAEMGKPLSSKRFRKNFRNDFRQKDEYAPRRTEQALGCEEWVEPIGQLSTWGCMHNKNWTRAVITDAGRAYLAGLDANRG